MLKEFIDLIVPILAYMELHKEINLVVAHGAQIGIDAAHHIGKIFHHFGGRIVRNIHLFHLVMYVVVAGASYVFFDHFGPQWAVWSLFSSGVILLMPLGYFLYLFSVKGIDFTRYITSLRWYRRRAEIKLHNDRIHAHNQAHPDAQKEYEKYQDPPHNVLSLDQIEKMPFGPDGRLGAGAIIAIFLIHPLFLVANLILGGLVDFLYGMPWVPGLILSIINLVPLIVFMAERKLAIKALQWLADTVDELSETILNNVMIRSVLIMLPGPNSENVDSLKGRKVDLPIAEVVRGLDADAFDPLTQAMILLWAANAVVYSAVWGFVIFFAFLAARVLLERVQSWTQINTLPDRQANIKTLTFVVASLGFGLRVVWLLFHTVLVDMANTGISWINSFMHMKVGWGVLVILLLAIVSGSAMPSSDQRKNESKPTLRVRYTIGALCAGISLAIIFSWFGLMMGRPTAIDPIQRRDLITGQPVQEAAPSTSETAPTQSNFLAELDRAQEQRTATTATPEPYQVASQPPVTRQTTTTPRQRRAVVASNNRPITRAEECAAARRRDPDLYARARASGHCR